MIFWWEDRFADEVVFRVTESHADGLMAALAPLEEAALGRIDSPDCVCEGALDDATHLVHYTVTELGYRTRRSQPACAGCLEVTLAFYEGQEPSVGVLARDG